MPMRKPLKAIVYEEIVMIVSACYRVNYAMNGITQDVLIMMIHTQIK